MKDLNDDNLDVLLREHFSAELDPQLDTGKRDAFAPARSGQLDRAPAVFARSSRRLPWRAAIVPFALAASIAAIFIVPALLNRDPQATETEVVQGVPHTPVEHEIAWNTVDQGTVFVDSDVPMRSILRERTDNFRWIDPETNASMEVSIPQNEVIFVGMTAY
jgi:hypothetical protein